MYSHRLKMKFLRQLSRKLSYYRHTCIHKYCQGHFAGGNNRLFRVHVPIQRGQIKGVPQWCISTMAAISVGDWGRSAKGESVERRRREDRDAEGAEGGGGSVVKGCPPSHWGRSLGRDCAPSPETFSIFERKRRVFYAL